MRTPRVLASSLAACALVLLAACALVLLAACSPGQQGGDVDLDQVDAVEVPTVGACRTLSADDVEQTSNATRTVPCAQDHTAQTYAADELPAELADAAYDSDELGAFAYQTCTDELRRFLGGDDSLSLRTTLTWAWFRPSEDAWDDGARWYRCDVVDGTRETDGALPQLPETTQGLLRGRPDDRWLACVRGASIEGKPRVPCDQDHDWRAVTTIKLGEQSDNYPGDDVVATRTKNFCADSVQAYLGYPVDYEFSYTWFHQAEWDFGNRRSICWAKVDQ